MLHLVKVATMAARRVLGDVSSDQPRMATVKPNWATSAAAVNCTLWRQIPQLKKNRLL